MPATATKWFSPATDPNIDWDKVDQDSLNDLDLARELAMIPFQITSNYRTPEHSVQVGGIANDAHTEIPCTAFDIACSDGKTRQIIYKAVWDAGFRRIGIKKNHVHVDRSKVLPQDVTWIEE